MATLYLMQRCVVPPGNAETRLFRAFCGDPQVRHRNQLVAGIEERESFTHPGHDAFLLQQLFQFMRSSVACRPDFLAAVTKRDTQAATGTLCTDAAVDDGLESNLAHAGPEVQ